MDKTFEDFEWLDLLPARGLLARQANKLAAVAELHTKRMSFLDVPFCVECEQKWPCATVMALTEPED